MVKNFSRRNTWLAACLAAILGMSLLIGLWKRPSHPAYAVLDLGLLGGKDCAVSSINASGLIIGTITNHNQHACVYQHEALHLLEEPHVIGSIASSLNRHQQVVDALYFDANHQHAALWQKGKMTDLGTLGGKNSTAFAINDRGEIVGFADMKRNSVHAFVYREGQMQDLGTLGGARSQAYSINNVEQIVGFSRIDLEHQHAFLWQNGVMTDLGTLGGNNSDAIAINDQGTVIGTADTAEGESHAFCCQAGAMQDLGVLPGGKESIALAINKRGQIVGRGQVAGDHQSELHAWLSTDGSLQDLNTLIPQDAGWKLVEARAINDRGQIVGIGMFRGKPRAFLLEPR